MWGSDNYYAEAKKLDDAVTIALKALRSIDEAKGLGEAKEVALRARLDMAERLK